jgi:DNA polymerase-3 subunit chi
MTKVVFHFNAPDRITYACRLLRKAVSSGVKVVVTGMPDTLQQLDIALWALSPIDFVPHCQFPGEAHMVDASPVILTLTTQRLPHHQVLLNLGHLVPDGVSEFERVIEIVTLDDEDRQIARKRWKQYVDGSYAIASHDLSLADRS